MLDAVSAAVAAVAAHLKTALPAELLGGSPDGAPGEVARIVEGWAGPEQDILYTSIVVDAPAPGDFTPAAPVLIDRTDPLVTTDANFTGYYSLGSIEVPIMLDVYAKSFAERAQALRAIEAALGVGILEDSHSLELVSADYHGQSITVWRSGAPRFTDSPGNTGAAEWRAIVPLTAELENVVPVTGARLLELRTQTTICIELALPAPSAEQRTIFAP